MQIADWELRNVSKKTGKLISVNDQQLEIEFTEGKNKKAVTTQLPIALTDIKQIIVLIKF